MNTGHLKEETGQLLENGRRFERQHAERMFRERCRRKEVMRMMGRKVMLSVVVNGER